MISRIIALSRVAKGQNCSEGRERRRSGLTNVDVVLCRGLEPSNEVVLLHKLVKHLRVHYNSRDITLWHAKRQQQRKEPLQTTPGASLKALHRS